MGRMLWHMQRDDTMLRLSRGFPARFDFAADVVLVDAAHLDRSRIAHQVRQDLWRALQSLRGYRPVIELRKVGNDLHIKAGGSVEGAVPERYCVERAAAVLSDPSRQARWRLHAARRAV